MENLVELEKQQGIDLGGRKSLNKKKMKGMNIGGRRNQRSQGGMVLSDSLIHSAGAPIWGPSSAIQTRFPPGTRQYSMNSSSTPLGSCIIRFLKFRFFTT